MFDITKQFSLTGKVALVTGAAYGIGYAIAKAYADAGAKIAFNCRSQEHMDKALADYKKDGIEAHGYLCDVTDETSVREMVADIEKTLGTIDILVNNAGIIKRTPMLEMETTDFRQVIDIDLTAPFIVSKAVLPGMLRKGHGKIINVCSMLSEVGRETVAAYTAAKGGLKMLTKNIASEFGDRNIQCNGIGPGYIATPQTAPLRTPGHPFNAFILSKHRRTAGVRRKISWVLPYSWHRTLLILSMATSSTWMAAFSLIWGATPRADAHQMARMSPPAAIIAMAQAWTRLTFSPNRMTARMTAKTTLSLSIGATLETGPYLSARK